MDQSEKLLTLKQAYLVMCEYLYRECELNNWQEIDLRSLLSDMELEGKWRSADPGAIIQFEDAVKKVLTEGSSFDSKKS
jgi:hypothetical protein